MVDAFLGKKYKLASSENFDEYMKGIGVGLITRKVGGTVSPVFEIYKNDKGEYVAKSTSTFKNVEMVVKIGEPMEYTTVDGRKVRAVFTVNGATITETQTDLDSGIVNTIERTWSADQIKMVLKVGDVVCTRIYKAC